MIELLVDFTAVKWIYILSIVIGVIEWLFWAGLAGHVAQVWKKRSFIGWLVLGLFLGIAAVVLIMTMPVKPDSTKSENKWYCSKCGHDNSSETDTCNYCGTKK